MSSMLFVRSVALLSCEGNGTHTPSPHEEVADVVAVHVPVAVPGASTVASLGAHVEASLVTTVEALLVTTVASAIIAQEPEPDVTEPELPVVRVERSPRRMGLLPDVTCVVYAGWTMRLGWLLGWLGWLRLFPRRVLWFLLVVKVLRWVRLLGGVDPIIMLVILVSSLSAVVVGRGVVGAIEIVFDFFCRVCVTGLPECGLGSGYDLAYGSVW